MRELATAIDEINSIINRVFGIESIIKRISWIEADSVNTPDPLNRVIVEGEKLIIKNIELKNNNQIWFLQKV